MTKKPPFPPADRRRLITYYLIACGWTWALWIPPLLRSARTGVPLPTIDAGPAVWTALTGTDLAYAIMFQAAVYGPLLAALVTLLAFRDRLGLAAWARSLVKARVGWRWYGFVVSFPVALGVLVVVTGTLLGGKAPDIAAAPALTALPLMIVIQFLTSGLEEPGWRGFALPLLQRSRNAEDATWILGLLWAAWHLPFMLYVNRAAPVWSLPLTLAGFTMSIVAMAYVHAWVYNSTGSVLLNILLHGWVNVTNTIAQAVQPNPLVPLAIAGFTWVFVAWLIRRFGKEHLSTTAPVASAEAPATDGA